MKEARKYSDTEILSFMERNDIEPSYSNLVYLKENISLIEEELEENSIDIKGNNNLNNNYSPDSNFKAEIMNTTNTNTYNTQEPKKETVPSQKVPRTKIEITDEMRKLYKGKRVDSQGRPLSQDAIDRKIRASISTLKNYYKKNNIQKDSKYGKLWEAIEIAKNALEDFELNQYNIIETVYAAYKELTVFNEATGDRNILTKNEISEIIKEALTSSKPRQSNVVNQLSEMILTECGLLKEEIVSLNESTKIESLKEITITVLNTVQEKLNSLDTSVADRSRGDIKLLKELPIIQDTITKLEALIERDENALPEYSDAISTVIKAILYINQYSSTFKDAYRNKKTLMILKYESLILSIISSVSYLISTLIDFKVDHLSLKRNVVGIMDFAPLKSLKAFIESIDKGEFKAVANDVNVLREYYLEVSVDNMSQILEATEYLPMIIDSVKQIYNSISNSEKIANLIYKAVGVVVLVFSLRDVFYSLFRMKTKISDMVGNIQNFSSLNSGAGILNKLAQFSNKFKNDAELGSEIAQREVEDENRKLLTQIKSVQKSTEPVIDTNTPEEKNDANSIFTYDF